MRSPPINQETSPCQASVPWTRATQRASGPAASCGTRRCAQDPAKMRSGQASESASRLTCLVVRIQSALLDKVRDYVDKIQRDGKLAGGQAEAVAVHAVVEVGFQLFHQAA